ncbi:glycosyltransferase [Neosynechococcus sphagnicola]|uniref:glycosyltransferase n=1 Tax=Neosynechococcus sphagnicola TaxID=1501145 RepID=UPI000A96EAC8|nr:glycosyltransferase [Neosynechococcus sphagnicola]
MIQVEPLAIHTLLRHLWHGLLTFVFYYPLVMSYAWMFFAVLFFLRSEYRERSLVRPPGGELDTPISILIPCFNEGDNAADTISHALAVNYSVFEVIAINDGSRDNTGAILNHLAALHSNLRVLHLVENQGKALALQVGCLLARYEILVCIDGDALLDAHALPWMVRHFLHNPRTGAVTGNPRIRNRSTLMGRVQVGEFSSIIGLIKRAQSWFGQLFTVSGVISAFRKSAVHQVGYWSADMLTEDIDITWKLQPGGVGRDL